VESSWLKSHRGVQNDVEEQEEVSQLGALQDLSEEISKTVLDAIRLVEAIGGEYLWVDAICIIQDNMHDMDSQIEHMNDIYAHAILIIVTAEGADSNAGLSGVHPHLRVLPQVTEEVDDGVRLALPLEPPRKAWSFSLELPSMDVPGGNV
jgi:hypothetical protein